MANIKISELPLATTLGSTDVFCIVQGGTTKQIDSLSIFPTSATNNAIAKYSGTSGTLLQNSGVVIDGSNNVTGITSLSVSSATIGTLSGILLGTTGAVGVGATTSNLPEGTNLYWTQTRFDNAFFAKSTTNLSEGTNLYYTQARFDSAFSAKSTTNLTEGTNLYYTTARVYGALSGTSPITFNGSTGAIGIDQSALTITESQVTNLVSDLAGKLALAGGTMAGNLILNSVNPTSSYQAVPKTYVDSLLNGLTVKAACQVATTANLNATYNNGTSGVGATLINAGALTALVVDGVTVAIGDRICVWQQTTGQYNGIYDVTAAGNGAVAWILTRSSDFNTVGTGGIQSGDWFPINQGTVYQGSNFYLTNTGAITIGTTALTFSQSNPISALIATNGITKTGNTISLDVTYAATFAGMTLSNLSQGVVTANSSGVLAVVSGNNGLLVTNGSGLPSITSTLPSAVQLNITQTGTIVTGTWNATAIDGTYINYNTTNLKVTTNALNTIQNIATSSTPTFAGITLNGAFTSTSNFAVGTAAFTLNPNYTSNNTNNFTSISLTPNLGGNSGFSGTYYGTAFGITTSGYSGSASRVIVVSMTGTTSSAIGGAVTLSVSAPTNAIGSNIAIGTENLAIGYTNTPPTNGAIINGSVGIGTSTPDASAILTLSSTTQGFLPPSMTTTQKNAISSPASGLVVFDNVLTDLQYYNGASWVSSSGVTSIAGVSNRTTASSPTGAVTIDISASYIGQSSITTLGTISTGTWHGSLVAGTYGGTGINNGASTITIGGSVTYSGAFTTTLTVTANTSVTLPTSGTLVNTAVTTLSSLTSIGTIGTGVWQGTIIGATYGGTGVNNGASTITIGGSLTLSGAFTTTLTVTGNTSITLPTSGTLVNTGVTTLSSLTSIGTIGTGVWQGTVVDGTYLNYNTTNLKVTSSKINTIQDISTSSNVQFGQVTVGSGSQFVAAGTGITTINSATTQVSFNIIATSNDASEPQINFTKNRGGQTQASDFLCSVNTYMVNSASATKNATRILIQASSVTSGSESSYTYFQNIVSGTLRSQLVLNNNGSVQIGDSGQTPIHFIYTATTTAGNVGTLTNCPVSGNPGTYIQISVNGVTRYIPAF